MRALSKAFQLDRILWECISLFTLCSTLCSIYQFPNLTYL